MKEEEVQGTGPGAVDQRPRWRRWLLAAIPWVAAAILAVLGLSRTGLPAPATVAAEPAAAAAPASPSPSPSTSRGPDAADTDDSALVLSPRLELAVLAAARAGLGTAGLAVDGPAGDRWPVEVTVVDVHEVAAGFAVATVHGLVIEHTDSGWSPPELRAVAVPLRTGPDGGVLGEAWPLPAPLPALAAPATTPVVAPDPSLLAPLEDLGWTVEAVHGVDLVDGHLLRIDLDGVPPGETHPAGHTVWLLDTPGGVRHLPPAPDPTQDPT